MANSSRIIPAAALAALLSAPAALAQMAWEDEGWDLNGDGVFDAQEFREGFRERINFAEWDTDRDGLLSEEEFGGGVYSRYDADATDAFEETEYGAFERDFGQDGFFGPRGVTNVETVDSEGFVEDEGVVGDESFAESEAEVFGDDEELSREVAGLEGWDIDGDGVLLRNEFQDGFREWGTFGEFDVDADGGISEDEFVGGVFSRYDEDGTGFIEEPELTDIGDDMGDEGFWDA